jgi:multiple sugar transport system substrate-binding protein
MKLIQKFKIFPLFLVLPLLAISCGGGGNNPAKAGTLTVWKLFGDTSQLQPILQAYREANPKVQIEVVNKDIVSYESDLLNALAAGTGPDIFSINNSWLPKYLDKTTPAPDTVFTYKNYSDTFVDTVVKDFTKDNKVYGTALSVDSLALYYNKDVLGTAGIATPPKTWEELASTVRKIGRQDATGYFSRSGIAMGTNTNVNRAQDIVYLLMLQAGAIPWTDDGLRPTFGQSLRKDNVQINPGLKALEFYTSFSNPNNINYTWNERSDYSIDSFANGRSAMLYSYSYARSLILAKAPRLNFEVAPVPQENLNDPAVNYSNYFGEVVNKQSKNTALAWDFLKFATSRDSLDKYYATAKQASSRKDLIELQIQDPQIGVFAHANLTAKPFYKPDQVSHDKIFADMINNIVLKGMKPADALGQAQSQAATLTRAR